MSAPRAPLTPPDDAVAPVRHPDAPAPGESITSHYDQCFGCGAQQPHGLRLETRAGEGVSVTAEFTVRPAHQGAPGLVHGGVLAAALDETLGSLGWLLRTIAVTGRLETDFVRPVPVDARLFLVAEVVAVAGRKIYARGTGRIGGPDGPVAVRANALFIEVETEHFVEHGRAEEIDAVLSATEPSADQATDRVRSARRADRAFEVNP